MSTVKSKNLQIGTDGTASNNFTIYQPGTPDGTLRVGNGNAGAATDAVTINSSGNVGIGTSSPVASLHIYNTKATPALTLKTNNASYVATDLFLDNSQDAQFFISARNTGDVWINNRTASGGLYFFTNNTSRASFDSAGRLSLPYQPMAHIKTNVTYNLPASTTECVWTNVPVNIGSHYSTSTGRFTAPITGKYRFTVSVHTSTSTGARGYIAINGTQYAGWAGSSDADWGNFGSAGIMSLAAGDYVSVWCWAGNYFHGDPAWGGWSIQLIG